MGLLVAQVLKTATPNVVIFGRHDEKLAVARTLGLSAQLAAPRSSGAGFDIVVDVTGRPEGLTDALDSSSRAAPSFSSRRSTARPQSRRGRSSSKKSRSSAPAAGPFNPAIALLASGAVRIDPLISRVAPLDDFASAFREARSCAQGVVRIAPR